MKMLSELGKSIAVVDPDKVHLDQNVKNILAYKPLLARIFSMSESPQEIRFID